MCFRERKQLSELKNLLGDHSDLDPPDSMPNSEVKRISADGSVGLPHVRVGHRQALNLDFKSNQCGAVVQLVRIPACHAGGRGFESRPLRHLFKNPVLGLGFVVLKRSDFPFRERVPLERKPGRPPLIQTKP